MTSQQMQEEKFMGSSWVLFMLQSTVLLPWFPIPMQKPLLSITRRYQLAQETALVLTTVLKPNKQQLVRQISLWQKQISGERQS